MLPLSQHPNKLGVLIVKRDSRAVSPLDEIIHALETREESSPKRCESHHDDLHPHSASAGYAGDDLVFEHAKRLEPQHHRNEKSRRRRLIKREWRVRYERQRRH